MNTPCLFVVAATGQTRTVEMERVPCVGEFVDYDDTRNKRKVRYRVQEVAWQLADDGSEIIKVNSVRILLSV